MSSNSPRSPKRKQSTIKSESQQSKRDKSQVSKKGGEQKSERSELAMQKKIENNDEDLAQLKRKLAIMKQMPQPENKEEMITFLI